MFRPILPPPAFILLVQDAHSLIVNQVAHRPWPMPARLWMMRQSWHDLLFAHWPLDPAALVRSVPPQFQLDLFGEQAWLGVVPFCMTDVAPRGVPSLPWLSRFAELNVRTYVRVADKPGVFFFSLDAGNALAACAARLLFHLPYFAADMGVERSSGQIRYRSRRRNAGSSAVFVATYGPAGAPFNALAGSLEYFLTERYCLYALDRGGRPYRLDIHHPPWSLQPAVAEISENTMAQASSITLPGIGPLLHFAARQDMVAWSPTAL
jgi:uncharacterized protein YqjF (DUF2071 family)